MILHLKRRKLKHRQKAKRVVIIGFDGLDPDLCRTYINQGRLAHLSKLGREGSFCSLKTSTPALSPVAWSTFATGVNPGKHGIFDFFTRDAKTYLPQLSSARIGVGRRSVNLGPVRFSVKSPIVKLLRKSTAVWSLLGKHKIFSTILRVPISFPPEKFYGTCLSAMCTPDLKGTQGSHTLFTTEKNAAEAAQSEGVVVTIVRKESGFFETRIIGPTLQEAQTPNPLTIRIFGTIAADNETVRLRVGHDNIVLAQGVYSPWVKLEFKNGLRRRIQGMAKFLVMQTTPHLKIYMTPINIDPEKPTLPISHPSYFSAYLAKLHGPFSTLGLAEDTWALNEGVIDDQAFITQAYQIFDERKKICLQSLNKNKEGLYVFVFDTTDRMQHMFFRTLDPEHPANRGKDIAPYKDVIHRLYSETDKFVGQILGQIDDERDLLMIISDHGFNSFKYGINLNTWLRKEGYLVLKQDASMDDEWLVNVDWTRTRAYACGLAGIYINTRGREKSGIVEPGPQLAELIAELKTKLESLVDNQNQCRPIRRVLTGRDVLSGPYAADAPDLIMGYEQGYRVSWNCARGKVSEHIVEENLKPWSGDHCIDPDLVPGVLFSNWTLENTNPHIGDIAPTILDLFGLDKVDHQDGKILKFNAPGGGTHIE